MKLGFTRDSGLLWLAFGAVLLTYLKANGSPLTWDFNGYVDFGLSLVMWGIGKLQTSPLAHSELGAAKITREDV
jgi:hypothetical protein